jgi:exodeoxyribonuclease V alpha subunit
MPRPGNAWPRRCWTVSGLRDRLHVPAEEIQVLTPERRGACGMAELNRRLRKRLNPHPGPEIEARPASDAEPAVRFAAGDRVIHTVNDDRLGVFNGEVGTVTRVGTVEVSEGVDRERRTVRREGLVVRYEDGAGSHEVAYSRTEARALQHAWALTVHRAQGSEYEAAVIALPWSYLLCTRRLLYTAVTRGRWHVVVLAEEGALQRAVRQTGLERDTALAERIGDDRLGPDA